VFAFLGRGKVRIRDGVEKTGFREEMQGLWDGCELFSSWGRAGVDLKTRFSGQC
jgi:hypothetical protein